MKQKLFLLIGLVVLILIAIFIFNKNNVSQSGISNSKENATSSTITWKTYTDSRYGITFTYPDYLGNVIVSKNTSNDCLVGKTYANTATFFSDQYTISFSNNPPVGVGGSYMEYTIPLVRGSQNNLTSCGTDLLQLRKNIKSDATYTLLPSTTSVVQTYSSVLGTGIGTDASQLYTTFIDQGNNITVLQPRITFLPYAGSVEESEIRQKQKDEDSAAVTAIVSYVNQSPHAEQIRSYLSDFQKIAASVFISLAK